MKSVTKVNGFPVIVHQGREITEAQFSALSSDEQGKCKRRINGPHHDAKWANGGRVPTSKRHKPTRNAHSQLALQKEVA